VLALVDDMLLALLDESVLAAGGLDVLGAEFGAELGD
jgi:hypothetical protein